jgi:ribosomal-protein-alanine N-acetyltransferase
MKSADIPQVMEIETASFTPSWGEHSFHFEINESRVSYMVALTDSTLRPTQGLRRWWDTMRGVADPQEAEDHIMAFGGLWHIEEEAHISTIASHPAHRGKHYGEIVLAGMVQQAIRLGAQYVVLEVRVSNTVAQNLYSKYGFKTTTVKRGYYQNNKEDAYDMRLQLDEQGVLEQQARMYATLMARTPFVDLYTRTPHPRLER